MHTLQAPWFDYTPDTRPMVAEMCVLCTHDIGNSDPRSFWPNGAVAHDLDLGCV